MKISHTLEVSLAAIGLKLLMGGYSSLQLLRDTLQTILNQIDEELLESQGKQG